MGTMVGELISFNLGANWISKLWKRLQSIRKAHRRELEEVARIMFGNPVELAKYYIEPSSQEMNPSDRHEEDHLVSHEPIMTKIDQFFRSKAPFHPGNNQMIILADAGMGKSALLTMLKLLHLTSFWPKDKDCVLKKLGPQTLSEIRDIENRIETILLLDSLDEDPIAYGRVKDRLMEILAATQHFHRVVITCRTQFFPNTQAEPLERPGLIQISGFICPTKYLSFFDDRQVESYLGKRFPNKFGVLPQTKLREEAKRVINKMGSLRCRPMLLSYVEDLMASPRVQADSSEYLVYKALIENWLLREEAKMKVSAKELFRACELLATESVEFGIQQKRSISERNLDLLVARLPDIGHIKNIEIKGRSLLNRDSNGDYRFSHFSFQEFLIAHRVLQDRNWEPQPPLRSSDLIIQFIFRGRGRSGRMLRLFVLDFTSADLHDANLQNVDLSSANLVGANLTRAELRKSHLCQANLSHANLTNANLVDADLSNADLRYANLARANLSNANVRGARLMGAYVPDGILTGANLEAAKLRNTDLRYADLQGANLSNADLGDAILCGANLRNVDLRGANLIGANLSGTFLKGALLDDPDLSDLTYAIFT
jgi:uncharacterized protein YjbI with pentapeptide repeats